ncbi:FtsX-like permease family protein [Glycomyces sp. NPDC049804]|uniref:FtsX-like permease family protein n=1 Tax=Glycomyces sp. NPDC049804 TaxID=3154363 RepID=UPI00343D501E
MPRISPLEPARASVRQRIRLYVSELTGPARSGAPLLTLEHYLLSPDLVSAEAGPWRQVMRIADGADEAAVAAALGSFGEVSTVERWVRATAAEDDRLTRNLMVMLLGLTMVYTVIAMVNAVVIAASNRRREFAAARVTGLSRAQVVRAAFGESQAVVAVGLLLGGAAAAASVLGVSTALRNLNGLSVVDVQWPLLAGLALGPAVVNGATAVVAVLSATRTPPVRLAASRE